MFTGSVNCPDWDDCCSTTKVSIEWESAYDQSEHKVSCSGCGRVINFTINYSPEICDEEFT